jgi:hypothetical protein
MLRIEATTDKPGTHIMLSSPLRRLLLPLTATVLLAIAHANAQGDEAQIHALLDDFHLAAAEADRDRYLGHFAPNGVFMGTDDWERWPLAEFTEYVDGRFSGGGGWEYAAEERHVMFAGGGDTAWFDEIMVSPRWGRFRGTGVLLRTDAGWKIAHYSLTALVPNERFAEVSAVTKAGFAARGEQKEP